MASKQAKSSADKQQHKPQDKQSDGAVYMLNALWFKPDSGAQLYRQYMAAAYQVILDLDIGSETMDRFIPEQMLIGDWDPDLFFVVKYPSKEAFNTFVNSDQYQAIKHLREDAIEKSLLVQCQRSVAS